MRACVRGRGAARGPSYRTGGPGGGSQALGLQVLEIVPASASGRLSSPAFALRAARR